ncbi:hypothetical protein [Halegenticoccus tardaugens]|uniref:hypothetical protein n=1 Tax=Halegenticoccus tardaugens TaxID=2071624 RepID=UPI00100AD90B|nr:hypothetical protein [Halegenticoccus tardaugens]
MRAGGEPTDDADRHGFDENRSYLSEALGKFVPQAVARRALSVDLDTDRDRYRLGEAVELTVTIANRLPVPTTVATPQRQLWGWTVDGEPEASDETRYASDAAGQLSFRARERKVVSVTWSGRFKRVGERTTWELPEPGTHEIRAFVATRPPRAADSVEIRIE